MCYSGCMYSLLLCLFYMEFYSWYLKIIDCLKILNCKINFFFSYLILKICYIVFLIFFFREGELLYSMDEGNLRGVGVGWEGVGG